MLRGILGRPRIGEDGRGCVILRTIERRADLKKRENRPAGDGQAQLD
jgi:hypothetical protein